MAIVLDGTTGITTPGLTNTGTETLVNLTTTGNTILGDASTDTLNVGNGGLIKDASGNVGVGVTPSAWGLGKAIEIGWSGNGLWGVQSSGDMRITANTYYDGTNYKLISGGSYASYYRQSNGIHSWLTSTGTTAGNATFTQAMTLSASGALSIGTTAVAEKVNLASGSGSGAAIEMAGNGNTVGTTSLYVGQGSDGNGYLYQRANLSLVFGTNNLERARIDSSGNLLVGVTTGTKHIFKKDNSNNEALQFENSATTNPYGGIFYFSGAAPNDATRYFWTCLDTSAYRAYLRSNGGLANYQANNVNLSDRREKTNFAPAGDYLAKICAIPVQTFNYIDQSEDDPGLTLGVVAQDVQAVAPELVMESNWAGKDEEPKMRLSIYQTDLQYALMKCIQEQQAIIQTLTDRITALENK